MLLREDEYYRFFYYALEIPQLHSNAFNLTLLTPKKEEI